MMPQNTDTGNLCGCHMKTYGYALYIVAMHTKYNTTVKILHPQVPSFWSLISGSSPKLNGNNLDPPKISCAKMDHV